MTALSCRPYSTAAFVRTPVCLGHAFRDALTRGDMMAEFVGIKFQFVGGLIGPWVVNI